MTMRQPHSKFILLLILLLPITVRGGHYELVKGEGIEVCEVYRNNLNAFKPKMAMACARPINSAFKSLRKPQWGYIWKVPAISEIRPQEVRSEFYQLLNTKIDGFLWKRDANPVYHFPSTEWPQWQGSEKQYRDAWKSFRASREELRKLQGFYVADLDIDNDGNSEHVYFEQNCGSVFGSLLLVLNKDYTDIDYEKTKLLMPHRSFKEIGLGEFRSVNKGDWGVPSSHVRAGYTPVEDSLHHVHYDVFQFRDQVYFDRWWNNHSDYRGKSPHEVGRLRVFTAAGGKTRGICTYRYRQ